MLCEHIGFELWDSTLLNQSTDAQKLHQLKERCKSILQLAL